MPLLDLDKVTAGLSTGWSGFLRDWDRSLRSGSCPETTRYDCLLAAVRLGRCLGEYSPDPDADDAAGDPADVTRAHVEAFQAWMIGTRSAATALNKHKGLWRFFKWLLLDEGEIDRSPVERVRQPKMPQKLIPVIRGGCRAGPGDPPADRGRRSCLRLARCLRGAAPWVG